MKHAHNIKCAGKKDIGAVITAPLKFLGNIFSHGKKIIHSINTYNTTNSVDVTRGCVKSHNVTRSFSRKLHPIPSVPTYPHIKTKLHVKPQSISSFQRKRWKNNNLTEPTIFCRKIVFSHFFGPRGAFGHPPPRERALGSTGKRQNWRVKNSIKQHKIEEKNFISKISKNYTFFGLKEAFDPPGGGHRPNWNKDQIFHDKKQSQKRFEKF